MQNVEVGQTFRVVNWMWTSESLSIAKHLSANNGRNQVIVKCNIKKGCFNAGKINEFGQSASEHEKETVIPPYTVVTLKSRDIDYITVDIAKDNKNYNFDMTVTNS